MSEETTLRIAEQTSGNIDDAILCLADNARIQPILVHAAKIN